MQHSKCCVGLSPTAGSNPAATAIVSKRTASFSEDEGDEMAQPKPSVLLQRVENGLVAFAILIAVIFAGLPVWVLFAVFSLFDLSMLGYLRGNKLGALCYNLAHNYSLPALLLAVFLTLLMLDFEARWLAMLAACWGFHVAVDRMLGCGLKLDSFQSTHLGRIGNHNHEK